MSIDGYWRSRGLGHVYIDSHCRRQCIVLVVRRRPLSATMGFKRVTSAHFCLDNMLGKQPIDVNYRRQYLENRVYRKPVPMTKTRPLYHIILILQYLSSVVQGVILLHLVGNFSVERVCWLYSVHEQSSVFSWRMSIKIHVTENRVNIYQVYILEFGETKLIFLRWP